MRNALFKKAKRLVENQKVVIVTGSTSKIFFEVESMDEKKMYSVILEYRDNVLKHHCTCDHMLYAEPTSLCSHKLACFYMMIHGTVTGGKDDKK